ncbi:MULTISPECIES: hypothetical protein [Chelativorans]|jgi:hypothetical protein|uniref:hypothetical protein n=1 Tax=Chelativorans TaxID=449972 RepID=UPI00140E549A|nr:MULTISPECIES: hypothetical protein [Chelativorans]
MALSVPIDTRDITITPVFKYITVEDVPASEREKRPVMKTIEAVEVRFAGSRLYSPVFPVDAMWKREGHTIITYAERWADQYRDFLAGNDQKAQGTPLEMLKPYGVTDAQLSLCRALKIYSIEALHHLEGQNLKSLQMNANPLKDMARKYMSDRAKGDTASAEIAALRAEIDRLKTAQAIPASDPKPDEIEAAIEAADDEYKGLTEDDLKTKIAEITGSRPRGNPSRTTLVQSLRELEGAA